MWMGEVGEGQCRGQTSSAVLVAAGTYLPQLCPESRKVSGGRPSSPILVVWLLRTVCAHLVTPGIGRGLPPSAVLLRSDAQVRSQESAGERMGRTGRTGNM